MSQPITDRTQRIATALAPYAPEGVAMDLAQMVEKHKFHLTISRDRNSKLGDYRAPHGTDGHRISVNGGLNRYAFLITFIHEVAHLLVNEKHGGRVEPHGTEWKRTFTEIMRPYLRPEVFPPDVLSVLSRHMVDPAASTVRDMALMRALRNHDAKGQLVALEELPAGSIFIVSDKRLEKGEKLRKRYRCRDLDSQRMYLVSGIAMVEPAF